MSSLAGFSCGALLSQDGGVESVKGAAGRDERRGLLGSESCKARSEKPRMGTAERERRTEAETQAAVSPARSLGALLPSTGHDGRMSLAMPRPLLACPGR
jgi:hypothetical protein